MTVRWDGKGAILLEGACPVEEAETLLRLLQAHPDAPVDWSACGKLHTAVVQVLAALRPALVGVCGDPFVALWLERLKIRW